MVTMATGPCLGELGSMGARRKTESVRGDGFRGGKTGGANWFSLKWTI